MIVLGSRILSLALVCMTRDDRDHPRRGGGRPQPFAIG